MVGLDYPLTRPFPSRILGPIVFTGAAISLVVLAVLNTALTAYQVTVTPSPNFNVTRKFWYTPLLPAAVRHKGNNCDPVVLGTGSLVTTTNAIFAWTVDRVIKADAGRTSFLYRGEDLDSCDIATVTFSGDLVTHSANIQVLAQCNPSDKVSFNLRTTLDVAELAARVSILGGDTAGSSTLGYGGQACDRLINAAGQDMLTELITYITVNPSPSLAQLSALAILDFCPNSNSTGKPCQTQKPGFNFDFAGIALSNGTFKTSSDGDANEIVTPFLRAPLNNVIQSLAACARYDFGQNNTNNILLHPTDAVKSGTILATFPAGEGAPEYPTIVGQLLNDPKSFLINGINVIPVPWNGKSVFEVAFLCRLKELKSAGEAFIAVLVATSTMFMSGWGIFMAVAIMILKGRRDDANHCVGHADAQMAMGRPAPYTMQSGLSDYSKAPQSPPPMAMPMPEAVPHLASQQYHKAY